MIEEPDYPPTEAELAEMLDELVADAEYYAETPGAQAEIKAFWASLSEDVEF